MIANARMYAVTPEIEAMWRSLLAHVAEDAGVALDYVACPAPQPLEKLWARPDLGAVLMCGFPIAMGMADVTPIAAPIPDADWAQGHAVYRSDVVVRTDAAFRSLADTFGHRLGWTVEHSHSGFNALRHHLLGHRSNARPTLYAEVVPNLITPRGVIDALMAGTIDAGPLDAYWHLLIARARPELVAGIRVLESTETAPMPAFVASASIPLDEIEALRRAFAGAAGRPWFGAFAGPLRLRGFAVVDQSSFATTLAWDRDAKERGYDRPA